VETFTYFPLNC